MWNSSMLATIHVARNQRYSAQNMAEKLEAYIYDRLMHREGARLIQLNDVAHFVHFVVRFQLYPLKSRKKISGISKTSPFRRLSLIVTSNSARPNITSSILSIMLKLSVSISRPLHCIGGIVAIYSCPLWKYMKIYENIWKDMKYILYHGRKYVTPVLGPPSSSALS
jgi:hypothetical protein